MPKLIEVQSAKEFASSFLPDIFLKMAVNRVLDAVPEADAVPIKVLEKWLYEIALNNTDNYLSDACEEIINRLDGLRVFAKERKTT